MDLKELKQLFETGTFYHYDFGFLLRLKVNDVTVVPKDKSCKYDFLMVRMNTGESNGIAEVQVFSNNVKKVKRPSNIIATFKWCYELKNEFGKLLGWIGEKEGK